MKTIHKAGIGAGALLLASYLAFSTVIFWDRDSGTSNTRWVPEPEAVQLGPAKGSSQGADLAAVYATITTHLQAGQFDQLIAVATDALKEHPKTTQLHYFRGFASLQKNQLDDAVRDFNTALEMDPAHADSYRFRALAHIGKGQFDLAIADADKACELDPKNAESYVTRAMAYLSKGENHRAKPDIDMVLKLDPRSAKAQTLIEKLKETPPSP